jgi:hypothetical protein
MMKGAIAVGGAARGDGEGDRGELEAIAFPTETRVDITWILRHNYLLLL